MRRLFPFLLALLALAGCDEAAPTGPLACASTGAPGTWEFLGLAADTLGIVWSVAASPHDPDLLLAATFDFGSVLPSAAFRSEDGGQTWALAFTNPPFTSFFSSAAFDFADPSVAYAVSNGGFARSTDAGQTWRHVELGLLDPEAVGRHFIQIRTDPTGETLMVSARSATGGGSLHRSTDGAATWTPLTATGCDGPDPPGTCAAQHGPISLAQAPSDPDVLYAGTNWLGNVLRSADGGLTWDYRARLDGLVDGLAVSTTSPDVVYLLSGARVYRSADGGQTVAPFDDGLPASYAARAIVQDPATAALFLINSSLTEEGGLWRRGPEDAAWAEVEGPVKGIAAQSALYVAADGWLYVGGDGLWRVDPAALAAAEPGPCAP